MKKINLYAYAICIAIICISFIITRCTVSNTNGQSNKKEIKKKADFYRTNYGVLKTKRDTVILTKDLELSYSMGFLKSVGKIKKGKREGDWYLFKDSLRLQYVVKYKNTELDTIQRPFKIRDESW